ncbi:MAG TPA: DNA mismatch repair protein MutS [Chitinophagales bacterium]|nr:DNA mismatch repair protein MutS [Chitinophagales bacterium]
METQQTISSKDTPLMQQYSRIKSKYPDAILLFRIGDFYETFGQDAVKTSNVLGIVLTRRSNGAASDVELAGFPHHALDTYLPKLVKAGYRVAICDQLEDPKLTKKLVKRGVTELITPGVAHNDNILDTKSNNYLASLHFNKDIIGIAFLDISTGEFVTTEGTRDYIDNLLQSFKPSEILFAKNHQKDFKREYGEQFYTYALDEWIFTFDYALEKLTRHFETQSLKGFGIGDLHEGIIAAGAVIHYLAETEHANLRHITNINRLVRDKYVWLDKFTIRNLELISSPAGGKSLSDVLDLTLSPMGARLLKKWLVLPLREKSLIEERLTVVEHLIKNPELREALKNSIRQVGDLERMISKVPLGKINPREVAQLKRSLDNMLPVKEKCAAAECEQLKKIADQINPCEVLRERIGKELIADAPVQLLKGNVIARGVSKELDELRDLVRSGKDYILGIQKREAERTGISSLKIGFNNVFGYYLEVTHTHKNKVPSYWTRKQTLSNAERYITPELKEYEEKIIGAEEKILQLEENLFNELVLFIHDYIKPVQINAHQAARLDCLLSFAEAALKYNYRKPEIHERLSLEYKEGRHPVIERQLPAGEQYVPNDLLLDNDSQQIIILTGPNMAGKSALLRQTALITLMAQIGSFVPAASASIGIVDKIFTRVGASDNISSGESTFMVEMNETASIVNNISERSLILLDEIGRGTSTYDGISIAWSLAEYLHNNPAAHPKTLFATHYHELNELANKFPRIKNYTISIKDTGNKVIFLRKLAEGGSKHSFGIHVAKMAGMPKALVERANEILRELEQKSIASDIKDTVKQLPSPGYQLSIFQMDDKNFREIKEILEMLDIDTLTPVEALLKLQELKRLTEKK